MIKNCLWLRSASEITDVVPDDATLDGTKTLAIGDMLIIADETLEDVVFFTLCEFADTQINEGDHTYSGIWSKTNQGYPVFKKTIFSYSLASAKLPFADTSSFLGGCALNEETAYLCEFFKSYFPKLDLIYTLEREPAKSAELPSYTNYLNETTQDDYTEEAGNDLVWQTDRVEVNQTVGGSGGLVVDQTTSPTTAPVDIYNIPGVLGNPLHLLQYDEVAGSFNILGIDAATADITVINSVSAPAIVATYIVDYDLHPALQNKVVITDHLYTGSKPEEGRLFIADINAGPSLSTFTAIPNPSPDRYSHLGLYLAFALVDDSTYGTDTHILAYYNEDSIAVLRESDGYSTIHQMITFDRNDRVGRIAGGRNRALAMVWDDSLGSYSRMALVFNGSTWSFFPGGTSSVYDNTPDTFRFFKDDSVLEYFAISGWGARVSYVNTSFVSYDSLDLNTYGRPYGLRSVIWQEPFFHFIGYTSPDRYHRIHTYDDGLSDMLANTVAPYVSTDSYPAICYGYDNGGEASAVNIIGGNNCRLLSDSPGIVVAGGIHIISSANDNSRIVLDPQVTNITSASVNYSQPLLGLMRYAVSVDDGVTWQVYENGVGFHALTALSDLASTTYGDISLFELGLQALDMVNNKRVSLAFCIDRSDASIDSTVNSTMSSFTYEVDYPAEYDYNFYGNAAGANVETRFNVSDAVYADVGTAGQLSLAFFDKLK